MPTKEKEEFAYQAEMSRLLHLIIHSLYTHPEVFLRELISNASDALGKARLLELTNQDILGAGDELKIQIEVNEKKKTFSIEDNGIGMTREDLINNLGTVAKSGTLELLNKLKAEGKTPDENLIGQFGVGFYSVFMVTDEVILETRHAQADSKGWRWSSRGQGTFSIEETDKKDRGTKITFVLKEEQKDFSQEWQIKNIIQKYSNFANFPIFLGKERVNQVQALWQKKASEIQPAEAHEFYKFVANDFEDPMGYFHVAMEGKVNFKALVFIPSKAPAHFQFYRDEKCLRLYCNKIMIQEDAKDLIPEYLRFVKGVVDTEDLPLNVSREITQNSPVAARIRSNLTSKIFGFLEGWAATDKEKYEKFFRQFGPLLKLGLETDFENRDKLLDLLRFESSELKAGELTSFKDYVSRMKESQKELYFLTGEKRELLETNPNLEVFKKDGVEVLFFTDPVDPFLLSLVREYDKKPIKGIDQGDLEFLKEKAGKIETPEGKLDASLLEVFKATLGDRVEDVVASKRLVDSPVTLVAGKGGMDAQMERMMRMMNKDFTGSKKVLEVNLDHPLVRNLSRRQLGNPQDPVVSEVVEQLYDAALLQSGALESPAAFIKRMYGLMEKATS